MKRHWSDLLAASTLFIVFHCMMTQTMANECLKKETCEECISYPSELCVWCEDADLLATRTPRCNVSANHTNNWCNATLSPRSNILDRKKGGDAQVQPTFYNLKLRPGDPVDLTVTVNRKANYPIDLYYLMDLSNSTKDDLEKLKILAQSLSSLMNNLTSKFRLGFGKFVDKVTWPYSDTYGPVVDNPCMLPSDSTSQCGPSYSFVNSQPLTEDSKQFERTISQAETSSNVDAPEGQLDALLQVIVCSEAIGWRKDAWHLVVVATDEQYHVAGDGRLAGIYTPNRGTCMTTSGAGGSYTAGLEQDYPSVSQIRESLREAQIIPLFTVTNAYKLLYDLLSEALLPVTSFVGELSSDSSNVLGLINDGYEAVASRVTLNVQNENVEVSIHVQKCGSNDTSYKGTTCTGVSVDEQAVFKVELKLVACSEQPISVRLEAIPYGATEVNITSDCKCNCSLPPTNNASECNYHGSIVCGACLCDLGWSGHICDEPCVPGEETVTSGCSPDSNTLPCFGRGRCDCNHCYCDKNDNGEDLWVGKYCECPLLRCDDGVNGLQCGGTNQGNCECGLNNNNECSCQCVCLPTWEDSPGLNDCDCKKEDENCETPTNREEMCYGHGMCICNTCECLPGFMDNDRCERCPVCDSLCQRTEDCVRQEMYQSSPELDCSYRYMTELDDSPATSYSIRNGTAIFSETTRKCTFKDVDSCDYTYYVALDPHNTEFRRSSESDPYFDHLFIHLPPKDSRTCPGSIDVIPIVVGIIVGIVAIGLLLLLIWWLLYKFALYREYLAFKREQASANWNQTTSPLYEPPTKKYKNPAYKKKTMT